MSSIRSGVAVPPPQGTTEGLRHRLPVLIYEGVGTSGEVWLSGVNYLERSATTILSGAVGR